ncbi:DUF4367 domain-containing protein [Bacillus sp. BHET2]|uniref:DUF4367 domain-containing protein n=1 Tax=Bacillus sp. BHET2 TaxID=2583818 RepID=UPI0014862C81|nr:DUF4367 domain-containing protein [Bacillus sp. BHET2]
MKKIFFLLIAASFLLIGYSDISKGDSLVTYDHNQLASDLEKEGIEPKLPTEFPVAITNYEIVKPPHESARHEIGLTGESGEVFTLVIHSAPVTYDGKLDNQEKIEINGNEGFYAVNDVTGPSVHWTDDDYHYILEYQTIGLETEVNKETMMAIAKSYE